jgi:hypothetical protein
MVGEDWRAVRGAQAGRVLEVLVGDGQAVERADRARPDNRLVARAAAASARSKSRVTMAFTTRSVRSIWAR